VKIKEKKREKREIHALLLKIYRYALDRNISLVIPYNKHVPEAAPAG